MILDHKIAGRGIGPARQPTKADIYGGVQYIFAGQNSWENSFDRRPGLSGEKINSIVLLLCCKCWKFEYVGYTILTLKK